MKLDDEYFEEKSRAFSDVSLRIAQEWIAKGKLPDTKALDNQWHEGMMFTLRQVANDAARNAAKRCVEIAQRPSYGGPGINIAEAIRTEFGIEDKP